MNYSDYARYLETHIKYVEQGIEYTEKELERRRSYVERLRMDLNHAHRMEREELQRDTSTD